MPDSRRWVVLGVYAILRFEDLANRGVLRLTLKPGYEMYLFWLEISLAIILPLALLLQREGIDAIVLESRDRDYVERRTRAGPPEAFCTLIFFASPRNPSARMPQ